MTVHKRSQVIIQESFIGVMLTSFISRLTCQDTILTWKTIRKMLFVLLDCFKMIRNIYNLFIQIFEDIPIGKEINYITI